MHDLHLILLRWRQGGISDNPEIPNSSIEKAKKLVKKTTENFNFSHTCIVSLRRSAIDFRRSAAGIVELLTFAGMERNCRHAHRKTVQHPRSHIYPCRKSARHAEIGRAHV